MKKRFLFATSLLAVVPIAMCISICSAQTAPPIQWQNTIGGDYQDRLFMMQQTIDGGYILGGLSLSDSSGDKTENAIGFEDYWIVKTDSSGSIQWENTIGGTNTDYLHSITQTTDGGYIIGGHSRSDISGDKTENSMGTDDYWIVKIDSLGNIQWQNTIGGSGSDQPSSVSQTHDGGYILGGSSQSNISGDKTENSNGSWDYWIIKTDSLGNLQWQNSIGGSNMDVLVSVRQTIEGGYILGGYSESNISGDKTEDCSCNTPGGWCNNFDYWVVKTDSSGTIQWQNTVGGYKEDYLLSIYQTSDNGYILGGYSKSNSSGDKVENNWDPTLLTSDYWILKIDFAGNIQWQNTIGGNSNDLLDYIQQTADGGYILGGSSQSMISGDKTENTIGGSGAGSGVDDYWIIKTDSSGNIQWQNTIGGNDTENLESIQQTADGGYILGGSSNSDISGDKTENNFGSFYAFDYWIVKLAPDTLTGIAETGSTEGGADLKIFPNPAGEYVVMSYEFEVGDKIRLSDTFGRTLFTKIISEPTSDFRFPTSNYAPGIYFVEVLTSNRKAIRKVVKQ